MSDKLPKENNELAQVLNRINSLMKHGEAQAESPVLAENPTENIPQLTEVYEGEPLIFISRPAAEFPTLNEIVSNSVSTADTASAEVSGKASKQAEKMEALLAQMAPLVQVAIKEAALQKIIDAEQARQTQIEAEIMQTLRERLQSLVLNVKS